MARGKRTTHGFGLAAAMPSTGSHGLAVPTPTHYFKCHETTPGVWCCGWYIRRTLMGGKGLPYLRFFPRAHRRSTPLVLTRTLVYLTFSYTMAPRTSARSQRSTGQSASTRAIITAVPVPPHAPPKPATTKSSEYCDLGYNIEHLPPL